MAQLGWIAGTLSLLLFSVITFYTCSLLADSYRTFDPVNGKRNYNYRTAVKSHLGTFQYWLCVLFQYLNLYGTGVGYTITASISAKAISKSNCFHNKGHNADCLVSENMYTIGFGVAQVFFSQLPDFHELWCLSTVAAIMSFTYSLIAIGLSVAKIASGSIERTSLTGTQIGVDVTTAEKIWSTLQAVGDIAFAYSYALILIEIQDTVRSPPSENKVMKKAAFIGVSTTTIFYIMCGCFGYLAFGNRAPGNMLTDFGFFEPFWLVDIANFCIIVHLAGAYQVFSQPLFAAFESWVCKIYPNVSFLTHESPVITSKHFKFNANLFRIIWRTIFVVTTTFLAILMPFFNDILGFLGAIGFWPLTVYFPIEMYIAQKNIEKYSRKWMLLQSLSIVCFFISLFSAVASVEGVIVSLQKIKPFHTKS